MFTAYRPQQDQTYLLESMELAVQGQLTQSQGGNCGRVLSIFGLLILLLSSDGIP